ncbi:PREDICTED: CMT1A duplicated region transcript 1 protein [Crocodylus porosus]|uniref:F-box and WD repeat domain containing 10 n=1 Tax=Crocodylus porosus TaxID=8502 RepID=A0A7M4EM13_CROPO|nr:PREDICTED: CMT1A duplicated region transcript 1 protein [Crocodylus porosus]
MERQEYSLHFAPDLRCEKKTDLVPVCQTCEMCVLGWKVFSTKEWFLRASSISQKKFLTGIVKRLNSLDLLRYTEKVLQATHGKDAVYARSQITSSLKERLMTSSSDRALDTEMLERAMLDTWWWFTNSTYWTKANYTLFLLQMCDPKLLLIAANLVQALLNEEESFSSTSEADEEKVSVSVLEPKSSFKSEEHTTSISQIHLQPPSQVFSTASTVPGSGISSAKISQYSEIGKSLCFWPRGMAHFFTANSEKEDELSTASSINPALTLIPASLQSASGVNKYKDFIRCLPIHLSKYILGFLDPKSLSRCTDVTPYWAFVAKEVKREHLSQRVVQEELVYLQGSCPKGVIPNYAKTVDVTIPRITKDGDIIPVKSRKWKWKSKEEENNLQAAYHGQQTEVIRMEERNILCSSYNVRVLIDQSDPNRVIHYSGGNLLAIGSADRKVKFLDIVQMKEVPPVISGHAGSIKALFLNEKKGFILSASFDLSIRCWNIYTGVCVRIFNGHTGTITCLDLYKNKFVSGSKDCTIKVWDLDTGRCIKTLKHKDAIWTAKINSTHIVSGCERGLVKVWHVDTCTLVKTLEGHQGSIKCLSFDQWHLVTGSADGYALGWSMVGKHKSCLMAFRHPKDVLYLEFLYLRVISSCADGKIRIFNFLTGTCLKVMRANSRGEPGVSFYIIENRMVINALSNILLFNFEEVEWDYTLPADREAETKDKRNHKETPDETQPNQHAHAQRMRKDVATQRIYHLSPQKYDKDQIQLSYVIRHQSPNGSETFQTLHHELVNTSTLQQSSKKSVASFSIQPEQERKLSRTVGEFTYESLVCVTSLAEAQATFQSIKKRGPHCVMSPDRILLTVSTLQDTYKSHQTRSDMMYKAKIRDAWGSPLHQKEHAKKVLASKIPKQQKQVQTIKLKHMKSASGSLTMKRVSTPFETKKLQLNLRNSLHMSSVRSCIPAPTIVRSKSCCNLSEEKARTGSGKATSLPEGEALVTGHLTSTSESIKSLRMMIAQAKPKVGSVGAKPVFTRFENPYRINSGFRLLTVKQMKAYEEATVAEYKANQTKVIADQQKECKKAWVKKIKGLPIDYFTKEGKIAAPELGLNVYV